MTFSGIMFLFGGLAIAGPLLAHLLARPRYRRVPFAMMRFLKLGETESQSRRRLRNLLVLLIRCAIILLVAALFARPAILLAGRQEPPRPVFYLGLDNSMSMAYGDHLDKLRAAAAEAINRAPDKAVFHFYCLASGTAYRDLSKNEALAQLKDVTVSGCTAEMAPFLAALHGAKGKEHEHDIVTAWMASDFTPAMTAILDEDTQPVYVDSFDYEVIGAEKVSNAAVVDAAAQGVGSERLSLAVAVANYGLEDQHRTLAAKVEGRDVVTAQVDLAPGLRRVFRLDVPTSAVADAYAAVEIALDGQDPLAEDDAYYLGLALPARDSQHVLVTSLNVREGFLVKTALEAFARNSVFDDLTVRHILHRDFDTHMLDAASAVVLTSLPARIAECADALRAFAMGGGTIIFFTPPDADAVGFQQLAEAGVAAAVPGTWHTGPVSIASNSGAILAGDLLNPDGSVIRALDNYRIESLPLAGYYDCGTEPGAERLWVLSNGVGFLHYLPIGKGATILVNTSADDSLGPLLKSPAAVAFCRYLLGEKEGVHELTFLCGESASLPATSVELAAAPGRQAAWVVTPNGTEVQATAAGSRLTAPAATSPGWLRSLARPLRYAGINVPEGETDMVPASNARIVRLLDQVFRQKSLSGLQEAAVAGNQATRPLWREMAWAAIALLLVEAFLANRLKR